MRILICGSRDWKDIRAVRLALWELRKEIGDDDFLTSTHPHTVIHGNCRGADKLGDKAAREIGFHVEPFPAQWLKYGPKAGPIRNQAMVNSRPDLVLAFGTGGKGTKDVMERALVAGIRVRSTEGV